MNVLQHTRDERNLCLKQNRPDRSYRDTLLTATSNRIINIPWQLFGGDLMKMSSLENCLPFRKNDKFETERL